MLALNLALLETESESALFSFLSLSSVAGEKFPSLPMFAAAIASIGVAVAATVEFAVAVAAIAFKVIVAATVVFAVAAAVAVTAASVVNVDDVSLLDNFLTGESIVSDFASEKASMNETGAKVEVPRETGALKDAEVEVARKTIGEAVSKTAFPIGFPTGPRN